MDAVEGVGVEHLDHPKHLFHVSGRVDEDEAVGALDGNHGRRLRDDRLYNLLHGARRDEPDWYYLNNEAILGRHGKRPAAHAGGDWKLTRPGHGDHAVEIAHLDHREAAYGENLLQGRQQLAYGNLARRLNRDGPADGRV